VGILPPRPGLTRSLRLSRALLVFCLVCGVLTTAVDLFLLRTWPLFSDRIEGIQAELSPDLRLGERTFAARQAYDFINSHMPDDAVMQYNPMVLLDRRWACTVGGRKQSQTQRLTAYRMPFTRQPPGIGGAVC